MIAVEIAANKIATDIRFIKICDNKEHVVAKTKKIINPSMSNPLIFI